MLHICTVGTRLVLIHLTCCEMYFSICIFNISLFVLFIWTLAKSRCSLLWLFAAISLHFQNVWQTLLLYPYLTHYPPPLVHLRCANEYFSKSKWILLLSLPCWHRLWCYRLCIRATHPQSAGVMYRGFMDLGHFGSFLFW